MLESSCLKCGTCSFPPKNRRRVFRKFLWLRRRKRSRNAWYLRVCVDLYDFMNLNKKIDFIFSRRNNHGLMNWWRNLIAIGAIIAKKTASRTRESVAAAQRKTLKSLSLRKRINVRLRDVIRPIDGLPFETGHRGAVLPPVHRPVGHPDDLPDVPRFVIVLLDAGPRDVHQPGSLRSDADHQIGSRCASAPGHQWRGRRFVTGKSSFYFVCTDQIV